MLAGEVAVPEMIYYPSYVTSSMSIIANKTIINPSKPPKSSKIPKIPL
jgi:hypothetical protein